MQYFISRWGFKRHICSMINRTNINIIISFMWVLLFCLQLLFELSVLSSSPLFWRPSPTYTEQLGFKMKQDFVLIFTLKIKNELNKRTLIQSTYMFYWLIKYKLNPCFKESDPVIRWIMRDALCLTLREEEVQDDEADVVMAQRHDACTDIRFFCSL